MTKEEFAAAITGREYRKELTRPEAQIAKESGLVIVSGASDDLMEFDGAIRDEVGCYEGGVAYLDENGLWVNECEDEGCPYAEKEQAKCKTIRAIWNDKGNPCWTFETEIPHAEFNVYEDGELYCVGIVFDISALKCTEVSDGTL